MNLTIVHRIKMSEKMDEEKLLFHMNLEEHEYKACIAVIKAIVKEHMGSLLWSDKKHPLLSKPLKCANKLLCQVCQSDELDCSTISSIRADLEKVFQKHKLQCNRQFKLVVIITNSTDEINIVKYQLVKSKDFAKSIYEPLITSSTAVVIYEQVL